MDLELHGELEFNKLQSFSDIDQRRGVNYFARTNLDPPCLSMNEHVLAIEKQFR